MTEHQTMGLDAYEFVIELEEKFGITLRDDEVSYFITLGDLHDCLLEKCAVRKRSDCPTRSAFHRLRQVIGVVFDIDPRSLRPNTPVLPLLGRWRRRKQWKRLKCELGLELPQLENWAGTGVAWGMIAAGMLYFLVATILIRDPFVALAMALFALLPGTLVGYVVGLCWMPTLREWHATLGGLSRAVAALNAAEFRGSEEPSTENDPLWDNLCDITAKQLGVRRETLRRDTRFVDLMS